MDTEELILPSSDRMDNAEEHKSIDINKLVTSLREEFKKLHPLLDECCIYRVPQRRRQLNEGLYTPKQVSIGPLHHGRKEFKAMEEVKIRYLQEFLQRTKVNMKDFLIFIKDKETRLRNCYAETIKHESDEFVKMILLDSVFVIEFSLRESIRDQSRLDRIFAKPWMGINIMVDLLLLENQLPLFILEHLFDLAKRDMHDNLYEKLSMNKLTCDLLKGVGTLLLIKDKLFEEQFPKAQHFVDLIRLCLQPPEERTQNGELKTLVAPTMMEFHQAVANSKFKTLVAPTITELHQAGVNFRLGSSNYLFKIKFKNGTLEIPKLAIADQAGAIITNLKDFEALNGVTNYVNDYFVIMSYLVSSAKDVKVLAQNGIIENWLSCDEDVSTLFKNLQKETIANFDSFCYYDLIENLRAYCKSPWHKWKATLKQNYFNTPWASISVIAAGVLLILTVIQTVFSIINK